MPEAGGRTISIRLMRHVWHGRVVLVVCDLCNDSVHCGLRAPYTRFDSMSKTARLRRGVRWHVRGAASNSSLLACIVNPRSGSSRRGLWLREMPIRPKTGAAMSFSWPSRLKEPSRTERASVALSCALDAALEAAEDGHVAGLQVRRASWLDEAQHDVRESGLHGGQEWPRWRGCWPCDGSFELVVAVCSHVHAWFFSQRSVAARDAHSAEDWRRYALFMAKPSKEPSRTERASVALACAWMQLLKLRKTATSQGCRYDVLRGWMKHSTTCGKAAFMAARVASLAWMLAMSQRRIHDCPSLLGFKTLSRVAASCRIVVVVAQPFSDVT